MKKILYGFACALAFVFFATTAHAAALPSGYTELTYIESTGTQWIDTGIVFDTLNTSVEIGYDVIGSNKNLFGFNKINADTNWYTVYNSSGLVYLASSSALTSLGGGTSGVKRDVIFTTTDQNKLTVKVNGSEVYNNSFDGTFITENQPSFAIFSVNGKIVSQRMTSSRVWYVRLYKNNSLVRNLVPAKNSSGVVGMYDTVSGQFFTNSGSGSFLPGEELDSCRNLFDKDTADANRVYGFFQQTGTAWYYADAGFSVRIPCKPNTTYTARYNGNNTQAVLGFGSTSNDNIPSSNNSVSVTQGIRQSNPTIDTPITLTTGPNDKWLIVAYNVAEPQHSDMADNLQIEEGSTATPYTPYNPLCATCSGTLRNYVSATGTGTQVGTPTPENPIDPVFFRQGRMVLRAVGDYKDTFDAATGKITRNVGVKVLDGTENWQKSSNYTGAVYLNPPETYWVTNSAILCTHFEGISDTNHYARGKMLINNGYLSFWYGTNANSSVNDTKTFLAQQYAAGTPVTIYYPLAEPVEENWTETSWCETGIKIATNLYNSAKFQNVIDALDTAVSTINNIVAGTIAQANSIGELASGKQTRPNPADSSDETCPTSCPNYRQCLLVEKDDGTPCWYEISDPFRDFVAPIIGTNTAPSSTTNASGYTQLEYIESTGTQYIDTGYKPNNNTKVDITVSFASVANGHIFGSRMTNTGGAGFAVATISNIFVFDYNGNRVNGISPTVDSVYRIVKNGAENQISYGTTVNTYLNTASTFSIDATMVLFGINTAGTITGSAASIKIYSAQIEESGVMVRDFVPVRRNSDSKYGMYDTVNGVFYPNAASSGADFTPGPEVINQNPAVPGMVWTATWAGGGGVTAGTVNGEARCTSVAGTNDYSTTNPTKFSELNSTQQTNWNTAFNSSTLSNYKACWCKVDSVTPTSGNNISPMGATEWTFVRTRSDAAGCAQNCAYYCEHYSVSYAPFVKTMFGM